MATPDADFRVSNDQAWSLSFAILAGTSATVPWLNTPAWAPLTAGYGPGMARTYGGDLYVTEANAVPPTFTSAASFAGDVDANGAPRWRRYGAATAYGRTPYDLTGATRVLFAIAPCADDGTLLAARATLTASSDDGTFTIVQAAAATVRLAVPAVRTFLVPPGLYRHGIYATFADARGQQRLRTGFLHVEQGIQA